MKKTATNTTVRGCESKHYRLCGYEYLWLKTLCVVMNQNNIFLWPLEYTTGSLFIIDEITTPQCRGIYL